MTRKDYIILAVIIGVYSIISFVNLGSLQNPVSFSTLSSQEEVIFSFNDLCDIQKLKIYTGEDRGEYQLEGSIDGKDYQYFDIFTTSGAFAWDEIKILKKVRYLKLRLVSSKGVLGEVGIYDNKNRLLSVNHVTKNGKALLDEQAQIPKKISYLNSSYFDEIYFARSAYEYTKGLPVYEWTHPPLGKLIQALPIKLFTMAPFYYRFMGNLSGTLMIAVMYLFGRLLFVKRRYAIASSLLMALDTFHFAQSRMGTVDTHLTLFIMLSTLFMFYYLKNPTGKNHLWNLFFSGLFFGLSVCVKWTGFWLGLGLAILYFFSFFQHKKYLKLKSRSVFFEILVCFFSFVILPCFIYCGSYFLFPRMSNATVNNIDTLIVQTKDMYHYHSTLKAHHFFTSDFYTWPISYKPVWYYTNSSDDNHRQTISGIGNIAIWWVGVLALIYLLWKIIFRKDIQSLNLLVMFLCLYLPYLFIGRIMFLYHYFPAIFLMMLAIVVLISDIEKRWQHLRILPIYLLLVLLVFILYYPVVSGMEVSNDYLDSLRLLKSWTF